MIKNLKALRKKIGLTQKEVAAGVGISLSYYSHIESMKFIPSARVLSKILEFFENFGKDK